MLRLLYALGWIPALAAALLLGTGHGPTPVLSGSGDAGRFASLGLGVSLLILGATYLAVLHRPPARRVILGASAAGLIAVALMPVLFSADAYAYAYYGDLLLHGRNPYGHDPTRLHDDLARAAVIAWDGRVPPRCIYGPLAVLVSALGDALGGPWGVAGTIAAQRLIAAVAYGACVLLAMRIFPDDRARAAFALNPVVLWSAAEGHNDALMLALILAAWSVPRGRALVVALATLVKAPALVMFGSLRRGWPALGATALVVAGYGPLALAILAGGHDGTAPAPADWQSPLGLLSAAIGRGAAIAVMLAALAAAGLAVRRLPPAERAGAFAFAAWFALPNAYPWYALWIVPLAARRLESPWAGALLAASLFAPARAVADAIFPQGGTFHGDMIALEYLPPLVFRFVAVFRRPALAAAAMALALIAVNAPSDAQTLAPAPQPMSTPVLPPPPTPPPPTATTTPTPVPPPVPTAPESPSPLPATTPPVPPVATPAPNPYGYIINAPPVPTTTPDGPHIIQVAINDRTIHAGGPLLVRVTTSANVVGVEARALGRFIAIPSNAPGVFALQYTLPGGIPFWLLNKNYDIVIAAATPDGRQVTVDVPMLLAR